MKRNLSDEARRILQAERRRLSRIASSAAKDAAEAARVSVINGAYRKETQDRRANDEALFKGLHSMTKAVMTSWGVNLPMEVAAGKTLMAMTDFKRIVVRYPANLLPIERGNWDIAGLRAVIADVKGLVYHEVGHNRFTVPYSDLWAMSPTHAAGATKQWMDARHKAWNALEDQRMEASVVADSPVIAGYLTSLVLRHLLNRTSVMVEGPPFHQWLLLIGRTYLPRHIRKDMRRKYVDIMGEESARDAERIVWKYMSATTAEEMLNAVDEFHGLVATLAGFDGESIDSHSDWIPTAPRPGDEAQQRKNESIIKKSAQSHPEEQQDEGDKDGDQQKAVGPDPDSDDAAEQPSPNTSPSSQSDKPSESPSGGNGATAEDGGNEKGGGADSITDSIKKVLEELDDKQHNNSSVDDVIREINEEVNNAECRLPRVRGTGGLSDTSIGTALIASGLIEEALRIRNADNLPIWQSRTSRGIIDPFQYKVRQSGSRDYHRMYDDSGDTGTDMAVSILLDVSGSMIGQEEELGSAAFACKKACEQIDIPCTVTTFDTDVHILWDAYERAEPVHPIMDGGTDPTKALADLENQRHDKKVHIVLLMTDGEFSSNCKRAFVPYRSEGRIIVGLGYGYGYGYGHSITQSLRNHGADEVYNISSLMQIPDILRQFLVSFS